MQRLCDAAVEELVSAGGPGYSGLTVRSVAKRAGVAPATAYTYFASKEHLVAEVFWRRFEAQGRDLADAAATDRATDVDRGARVDRGPSRSPAERATDVLLDFALVVAEETELAAACTVALLADDAEVRELRMRIGLEMHRRLTEALGADADPVAVQALELATTGALLQVGTGHLAYDEIPTLLAGVAGLVLGGAA